MKPNDKVVCVDDAGFYECVPNRPVKGNVYVVRGSKRSRSIRTMKATIGLWLVGIINPISPDTTEWAFDSERFRLVSEVGHPPIAVEQPQEVGV